LNKKLSTGIGILIGLLFLTNFGYSQVELTAFGLYHMNVSFPSKVSIKSSVESEISIWYPEWQAFFSSVLEQKSGIGFGGRIAYNLTPSISFEASLEYIMAKTRFTEGLVDNFLARLELTGFSECLETATRSGGDIIRYYGNIVFNFSSSSSLTPYATAGFGFTQFRIGQGVGPEIEVESSVFNERFHLYYLNTTALTFNGGLGVKTLFSPNLGLRMDARIFVCDPDFEQILRFERGGSTLFDDVGSVIQSGTHIDTNLNIGLFLEF
jgi:hypothetical protein